MRLDATTIKSALRIPAVLRAHGHTPRAGRMACPIHAGGNRSSFSVKPGDQYARCWACGWHGDVIALEHALGGGTVGEAIKRCAELAGLRQPRPWERKPWLERDRRRQEYARAQAEQLVRWWQWEHVRVCAAELDEAERELGAVGQALARDRDAPALWAWLDRAVTARDRAQWAVDVEDYQRVMVACGGGGDATQIQYQP